MNQTTRLKPYLFAAIGIFCGLMVNQAQAQTIYTINSATVFGDNGANAGTTGSSFTDNMDGTFSLANATDSGANNAVFMNSSDGGSVSTLLGRALTSSDVVTVSGTISVADVNYNSNGIEFGLHSNAVFRISNAPNLLLQIDANNARGGFASFYGTSTPGGNIDRSQTPGATEASLNDGYSFEAAYSATDIVYTVSDVITTNEIDAEPVGATSFSFSLTEAVAADPTLQPILDDYLANYSTIVGDSFAYFSHQRNTNSGISSTFSNFEITVSSPVACILGDVDKSGVVDFVDIAPFIGVLSSGVYQCEADCDGSGAVDFVDIAPFIAILSGP